MSKLPAFDDSWCTSSGDPSNSIVPNMNAFAPQAIYTLEAHISEMLRTLTGDACYEIYSQIDANASDGVLFLGNYGISINAYNLLYNGKLRCNGWDTLYSRWGDLNYLADGRSVNIGPAVYKKSGTEIEARLNPPISEYMRFMKSNGAPGFYDETVRKILINVHIGSGETILHEYIHSLYKGFASDSLAYVLKFGIVDLFARWTTKMFTGTYGAFSGYRSFDPYVTIANELRKGIGDQRFTDMYFKPDYVGATGQKLSEITQNWGNQISVAYTEGCSEELFGTRSLVDSLSKELINALP